jgi:hypothetical protein
VFRSLLALFVLAPLFLTTASVASAAPVSYQFAGTTSSTMSVNNGTSVGSVPAGTPFSGTLAFDSAQTATPVAFSGGTKATYSFSSMSLTMGSETVSWGPGKIDVYNNLTSTSNGYPLGDSLYANINGVAPSGTLMGAQFNWIFLGLVDNSGAAFSSAALPANLSLGSFNSAFIEFNYGTRGTPFGAGNTSTIQFLSSLSTSGGSSPISFSPTLPSGVVGTAYSASFSPATGGAGGFTYTASGLPAGLSLSGTTISGTPTTAGSSSVVLTAKDSAGASKSATVPLTISDPTPVACSGKDAVITSYVARNPGFIVVNGGRNVLDHLWTTNLNASNTTFLGGLQNWYQTGLIVSYKGTVSSDGCLLTSLTVAPAVTIDTSSLPNAVAGQSYSAPITVSWGVAPYKVTMAGLPSGLTFDGSKITGMTRLVGTYTVTVTAKDAAGGSATKSLSLAVVKKKEIS